MAKEIKPEVQQVRIPAIYAPVFLWFFDRLAKKIK